MCAEDIIDVPQRTRGTQDRYVRRKTSIALNMPNTTVKSFSEWMRVGTVARTLARRSYGNDFEAARWMCTSKNAGTHGRFSADSILQHVESYRLMADDVMRSAMKSVRTACQRVDVFLARMQGT